MSRTSPEQPQLTQYLRADCHKLSCRHCGPIKAKAYLKAIARAATEANLCRHFTLTLDPKKLPPGCETTAHIRKLWNQFLVTLSRKLGYRPNFICVLELQANGNAHLHVLIRECLVQDWIIETWEALGGGYEDRIRYRDVHSMARYLAPYVTKQILERIPPGRRKATTSRGIVLFPKRAPTGWMFLMDWFITLADTRLAKAVEAQSDDCGLRWFVVDDHGPPPESPIPQLANPVIETEEVNLFF